MLKTDNFFKSLSKNHESFNLIFDDSRLISTFKRVDKTPMPFSNTLSFINNSSNPIKCKSFHEAPLKKEINDKFGKNIHVRKLKDLNLMQSKIKSFERRSTTSEFRIKNLEILNKLKKLCTNYLINPENLQEKIVKCLLKSFKTLNE